MTVDPLFLQATQAHQQGQLKRAEQLYQQLLALTPHHAEAHHLLGLIYSQQARYPLAIDSLKQAVALVPTNATFYNNLGEAQRRAGQLFDAEQSYQTALQLAPQMAPAHYNLANVLKQQGTLDRAIDHYQQALALQPDYVKAHYNLSNVYLEQRRFTEAIQQYKRTLHYQPDFAPAHRNLGLLLDSQGDIETALPYLKRAIALDPTDPLFPFHVETRCPAIFESNAAIDAYRLGLDQTLDRYLADPLHLDIARFPQPSGQPSLMLTSHGRDDCALKQKYAQVFEHCFNPTPRAFNQGKPRVGFVVLKQENLFLQGMGGILERMPSTHFDLTLICNSQRIAQKYQREIKNPGLNYLIIPGFFDQAVQLIDEAQFDLLYYWEVETDPINYFLPFCGLAPIQCTGWGWPVTTGIPQMDYYISSNLLENSDNPQKGYCEELVLFESLPAYFYRPPALTQRPDRTEFGFSMEQNLYLCNQQPRKFHPDFDQDLANILRGDPQGVLLISGSTFPTMVEQLFKRWRQVMPDVVEQIQLIPWFPKKIDYYRFLATVDVNLDTLYFGGLNTIYDTLGMGTPVITRPTLPIRGRYCYGSYQKMGFFDCVAETSAQFVDIALALGTDRAYRAEVSRQIEMTSPPLFEDQMAVNELTNFFERVLAEKR
ncbi:MAG: tetratricopeptide repeat protein [Chloroflexota bacterium]